MTPVARPRTYLFGAFRLQTKERALYERERPVPLGERAMDLLLELVDNASQVVSKFELIHRVWPDAEVDESTLRFHISSLRKALGEGKLGERYIMNVAGRGYIFVANVERLADVDASGVPLTPSLPSRPANLLGRDRAMEDLTQMLADRRFVSIVGPGGMGKSSLAFVYAERHLARYPDGVFVLDLSVIGDAQLVPVTLAHQIGLQYSPGGAVDGVCRWFGARQALVVLDSCETQVEACATLAQSLLLRAPAVHVLATSREALRVHGEWTLGLKPLSIPQPPWSGLKAEDVLAYPAISLLVERARSVQPSFKLDDEDVEATCELASRLDGMPLALEIAAVRLDALQIQDLLAQLETRFMLRADSSRTSIGRHRTISALLDWSYERLTGVEQAVLRRLSVCNGAFSLDAAQAVAADPLLDDVTVVEAVMALEMKSLVSVEREALNTRFRLLDSTREYAAEKLGDSDEYREVRFRQCAFLREMMLKAESDWSRMTSEQWLATYSPLHKDMRGSLTWAFGPDGDVMQGVRLIGASIAFGHQISLQEEYRGYAERALSYSDKLVPRDPQLELKLWTGLSVMQLVAQGSSSANGKSWARTLEIAEELDSDPYRIVALNGLFVHAYFGEGDYPAAARYARLVSEVAARSTDPNLAQLLERLELQTRHGLGEQHVAYRGVRAVLQNPRPRQRLRPPYPIDLPVMMRMLLTRILWLRGQADDAIALAEELEGLAARDVRYALSNAYAWSICPVYLWSGDETRARQAVDAMYQRACEIDMPFNAAWACAYDGILSTRQGRARTLHVSASAVEEACATGVVAELLGTLDPRWVTRALEQRSRAGTLGWCAPEILRARGDVLLAAGSAPEAARTLFEQALHLAAEQGALAWQLRAATSLAELSIASGAMADAHAVLAPVFEQFRQGLATADLRKASRLLNLQTTH